jgi:uncharacterized domain 1
MAMITKQSPLQDRLKNVSNPCASFMQPKFIDYIENESITYEFPVLDTYLNPWKCMQGGLISAAFDNAFGALALLLAGKSSVTTIDLNLSYHRPIYAGDSLMVKVYLKSKGKNIITMWGEAFDSSDRLIATATSKLIILHNEPEK